MAIGAILLGGMAGLGAYEAAKDFSGGAKQVAHGNLKGGLRMAGGIGKGLLASPGAVVGPTMARGASMALGRQVATKGMLPFAAEMAGGMALYEGADRAAQYAKGPQPMAQPTRMPVKQAVAFGTIMNLGRRALTYGSRVAQPVIGAAKVTGKATGSVASRLATPLVSGARRTMRGAWRGFDATKHTARTSRRVGSMTRAGASPQDITNYAMGAQKHMDKMNKRVFGQRALVAGVTAGLGAGTYSGLTEKTSSAGSEAAAAGSGLLSGKLIGNLTMGQAMGAGLVGGLLGGGAGYAHGALTADNPELAKMVANQERVNVTRNAAAQVRDRLAKRRAELK